MYLTFSQKFVQIEEEVVNNNIEEEVVNNDIEEEVVEEENKEDNNDDTEEVDDKDLGWYRRYRWDDKDWSLYLFAKRERLSRPLLPIERLDEL